MTTGRLVTASVYDNMSLARTL